MAQDAGPGEKLGRAPRTNNTPQDDDEQTTLERELASSGRGHVTVSADDLRRRSAKGGSEVAPTAEAEERERERHENEAKVGRHAAGVGDRKKAEVDSETSRDEVYEAARAADERRQAARTGR